MWIIPGGFSADYPLITQRTVLGAFHLCTNMQLGLTATTGTFPRHADFLLWKRQASRCMSPGADDGTHFSSGVDSSQPKWFLEIYKTGLVDLYSLD